MKFSTILIARVLTSALSFVSFIVFSQSVSLDDLGKFGLLVTSATLISSALFEPIFQAKATYAGHRTRIIMGRLSGLFFFLLAILSFFALCSLNSIFVFSIVSYGAILGYSNFQLDSIRLRNQSYAFVLCNTLRPTITFITLIFAVYYDFPFYAKVVCWPVGAFTATIFAMIFSSTSCQLNRKSVFNPKAIVSFVITMVGSIVLSFLVSSLDRYMLVWYGYLTELGRYTFAYDLIFRIFSPMSGALFLYTYPLLVNSADYSAPDKHQITRKFFKVNVLGLSLAAIASLCSSILVIRLSIHSHDVPYSLIIILWMGAIAHSVRFNILEAILKKSLKTNYILICSLIVLSFNFGLNILLIPAFQEAGAACATLLSYIAGVLFLILPAFGSYKVMA